MVSKKNIYQSRHPFHVNAFEALSCSSWRPVESVRISNGTMALNFADQHFTFSEKVPFVNVRVKSRQATITDCSWFLRPGVDISVLTTQRKHQNSENDTKEDPVWLDCRVSSVARKPHESACTCEFYVNLYTRQAGLGSFRESLCKDVVSVGIDQIRILQRLSPSHDQVGSEDISVRQKTKLFLGKFLTDMTWLVVASSVKKVAFDVRSAQGKLAFRIVDDEGLGDKALSFREQEGVSVPLVVEIARDDADVAAEAGPAQISGLRRSKRRYVQPERFLACDSGSEIDIGFVRERPIRFDRGHEDDMDLPLSSFYNGSLKRKSPEIDEEEDYDEEEEDEEEEETDSEKKKKKKYPKSKKSRPNEKTSADPPESKGFRVDPKDLRKDDLEEISPQFYYYPNNGAKDRRVNGSDLEDFELQTKWSAKPFVKRTYRKKRYNYARFNSSGERTYHKRSLGAGAYTEMINAFLKNMDCTFKGKEEPDITAQWNESTRNDNPIGGFEPPMEEEPEEMSETDILWQECELALTSLYVLDENGGSTIGTVKPAVENCKHEYVMNDELGILCDICGDVITGIRDITSPFAQNTIWHSEDRRSKRDFDRGSNGSAEFDYTRQGAPDEQLSEDKENVWALIPEIKNKLHPHQKKAFEFLWQNVAGSLKPEAMESISERKTGGCVISHTPGAGKTFLIIAFLVSYLKLFPGKRPLILAPKTTLYTWYKEFIKWKIPVPVYLIHGRRTYKVFKQSSMVSAPGEPKPTGDVKHILDCLEKIQKWHSRPSVLVMGYTSFLSLMREDSKFEHRKFMAKVMRESPGLMVLDEGHNPRSTKSRLRKALMKVETDLRILLSGTVFQNNFCEYFNTLCLARPKFVSEVLKSLDPKYDTKKKSLTTIENRARKMFLDTIAKKIDSNEGSERKIGLKMLKKITNKFIDAYEPTGGSDGLPGLQIYTILMNSTESQNEILMRLDRIMSTCIGYPLELELLITLASIHPWLVKTTPCSSKFFSEPALLELDKVKHDLKRGSKVQFVLNLVHRVFNTEKILIFCHNIAPVRLFAELFERVFGWKTGREVLVLTGDLELFERGRVMDKFEEQNGASRVLLASITACAEGISLTAASRVIMLDSEWNPSKTKQAIARAFRPGQRKVVYVYQLLATGTLEEDKYRRTTWKEWVSNMIFSEEFVEDPSRWQEQKIEDDVLREMVNEDKSKSFHMIMKNEKASTVIRTDHR